MNFFLPRHDRLTIDRYWHRLHLHRLHVDRKFNKVLGFDHCDIIVERLSLKGRRKLMNGGEIKRFTWNPGCIAIWMISCVTPPTFDFPIAPTTATIAVGCFLSVQCPWKMKLCCDIFECVIIVTYQLFQAISQWE